MQKLIATVFVGAFVSIQLLGAEPVSSIFEAIRANDRAAVANLLTNGADLQARDASGNTPLTAAARLADVAVLELLVRAGADVNATNSRGLTPAMLAATFPEKLRLLVKHRADINARSGIGNTALMLAARAANSFASVRFLLEQGAAADPTNKYGATPLMAAVASEDERTVRLLLDRGAYVNAQPNPGREGFAEGGGRTALQWAAYRGHERLVKLLLARGADVNQFTLLGTPLSQAAWGGHVAVARILLAAGARVDQRDLVANFTPLHWAASAEHSSPDLVNLLLARGADVNAEGGQPVDGFLGVSRTPLMLARQRGETAIVQALLKAGARADTSSATRPGSPPLRQVVEFADPDSITAAIQFALLPLQKTADDSYAAFRRHATRQDCISCHQQELPLAAFERANARYLAMNRGGAQRQLQYLVREMGLSRHFDSEPTFHPEPATGHGYGLFAMRMAGQPPSAETDTLVHYLATIQSPDGRWRLNLPRPPMQSGDITPTALALHGIRSYAPPGRGLEIAERVDRARAWLKKAEPELNEERAYQLLGLWWAGERPSSLKGRAADLIREQRPDGGWAQLATLPSDAYATGLSLFALLESSAVPATNAAVQNGLRFLLRTQLADGTWHVRRRAFPFQPPMDSGFPHGADGWISSTATSWAVLAMATALDPRQVPSLQPVIHVSASDATSSQLSDSAAHASSATPAAPNSTVHPSVDFVHTIQPLLERSCLSCHSGERAKGGFVLATRAALLKGGNRGEPPIVPGRPEASLLLRLLQDQVPDLEMPPLGKREKFPALTRDEIATLNRWIAEGANWPSAVTLHAPEK